MVKSSHSLEEGIQLLENAKDFASYVVTKYPQVNEKGELNYYLSGSLLVMLLSQAKSFDLLDTSKIPKISVIQTKSITENASNKLKLFARKIGDLDFVETSAYKQLKSYIPDVYHDPEGYFKEKEKFLFGGEGGPFMEELSESQRNIFEKSNSGKRVTCDSAKEYVLSSAVRINLNNQDYFISDPLNLFGYKFVSILKKFPYDSQKLKRDFKLIYSAFLEMYSEEELIEKSYEILTNFENANFDDNRGRENYIKKISENLSWDNSSDARSLKHFIRKIKEYSLEKS